MENTQTRDQEEKRTGLLKTVASADDGMAGYDRPTHPYRRSSIIHDFFETLCSLNGHRYGGIRPYRPPVPIQMKTSQLSSKRYCNSNGHRYGGIRPYQIQVCDPTRTDASNSGDHRYGRVCPVPSARTASVASSKTSGWPGETPKPAILSLVSLFKTQTLIP
jgi:hypothetical protein